MKTEKTLSSAIDDAAVLRANKLLRELRDALLSLLSTYRFPIGTGKTSITKDINNLLVQFADSPDWSCVVPEPTSEMIAACRSAIVTDILEGIPKLQEIIADINGVDKTA